MPHSIDVELERIAARDRDITALVGEEGRLARLQLEADELQRRYPIEADRPPLFGQLVGIKDIFHVDGLPTRAGSMLPPEALFGPEAACVRLLKKAGALILGKTTTTEFAFSEPSPTRNPHNRAHTPGGSSSGSAAAVAAGFCPLAIGSQMVGSIIRPAAFCGVPGFKPSLGRIPVEGMFCCSPSVDTVGIFAQSLDWMECAAAVLCAHWQPSGEQEKPVVGIPDGPYLNQASSEGITLFNRQIVTVEQAGWCVRRVPLLSDIESINLRHNHLISGEFARVHASLFTQYGHLYHSLTAELVRSGNEIAQNEIDAARAGSLCLRQEIEAVMAEQGIDMWLSPAATGPAPHGLSFTGDPVMNLPWTHTGLPAFTLPAGRAKNNLPVGLQCTVRFGMDEALLGWVRQLERII